MTAVLKLYEIADALVRVGDALIENGGELTPEIEAQLAGLEWALDDKVERTLLYTRNLEATASAADGEAQRLASLATTRRNAASRLKEYVKLEMERAGRDKVETDRIVARIAQNGRPSISWVRPIEDLPDTFVRVRRELDGTRAYEEWKHGNPLPDGFEVVRGTHLRVR